MTGPRSQAIDGQPPQAQASPAPVSPYESKVVEQKKIELAGIIREAHSVAAESEAETRLSIQLMEAFLAGSKKKRQDLIAFLQRVNEAKTLDTLAAITTAISRVFD